VIRLPCQAGAFYSSSAGALKKQIEECFLHRLGPGNLPKIEAGPRRLISLISPHAGYMFSGPVAAHGYHFAAEDGRPDTVIVLGPNHTGYGSGVSIMIEGVWRMPLGDVEVDTELASEVQRSSELIDIDESAHRFEHSIEVQLPFLQYVYGSTFKFLPICMMMQDLETSCDVGEAIAKASSNRNILIIASTDLSHYEPHKIAEAKDRLAIESMLKLDANLLQSTVESKNISMCGYGPVSAAIVASKKLGAAKAHLLSYKTSGDITGDQTQVVGYASLAITK
jgi:AmmeMemoRadiSam system protein B